MKKTILAIGLSALLLSGCVISIDDDNDWSSSSGKNWSKIEEKNREYISDLRVGVSIDSVRRQMGVPDFDELVVKNDKEHRILFYRTQRMEGDGATTKDECTPILFVNGDLIGFGESALNAI